MDPALVTALAAAALALLALLVTLTVSRRTRRRLLAELGTSRDELASLREEVHELSRRVRTAGAGTVDADLDAGRDGVRDKDGDRDGDSQRDGADDARSDAVPPEFVITSLADADPARVPTPPGAVSEAWSGREFATVALGESLVRVLALGHGVRRALSAENRNQIRFEIHREVKRARRQRRRDLKEAKRHLADRQRTEVTEDAA